jgi:glucosamine 6-phosphate synthetase-like amidotransferase/phosphosugar isomerase protein
MCSVFGAFDKNMYDVLMSANAERGTFAYSHCIYSKSNTPFHIKKFDKLLNPDDVKDVSCNVFYFGHCQAPTSSVRKWDANTSHPFECNNWVVAHNGVINNFEQLVQTHCAHEKLKVDSNVIPILLDLFEKDAADTKLDNETVIKRVLQLLQGTYAVWIINKQTHRAFVARQGSTLFANTHTGSFSSIECKSKGWLSVPEGYIYEIDFKKKKMLPLCKVETNSPFLFIPE